jgi:hypothetical protein
VRLISEVKPLLVESVFSSVLAAESGCRDVGLLAGIIHTDGKRQLVEGHDVFYAHGLL